MPSSSKDSEVVIDTAPKVPKNKIGMLAALIRASEDVAKYARMYLADGDERAAKMFMNARMKLKNLGTRQELPQFECVIMSGVQALTDEEREAARHLLETLDFSPPE